MEGERRVVLLDVGDILPNRFQPRIKFDDDAIEELSESIKRYGVIEPIIVRPIADKYEIIAGERRYKATVMAGLPTIPAIVLKLNDKESAEIALVENLQRRNLTPIEEAVTYKKVLDMGYLTQNDLAEKLGVKQSTVSNKLRLLNLDDDVQSALLENKISERHARSLLKLEDKEKQKKLLQRIINERLTVRRTDEEIKKILTNDDDIELLDIDNILGPKGEDDMNLNDPMNQFNIPTPTIEDDNPAKPDLMSSPVDEKQNTVAPGFLDIDRIEKEAQDIGGNNVVTSAPKFFSATSPEVGVEPQVPNPGFTIPPAMPNVSEQPVGPMPQVNTVPIQNVVPQQMPNMMPNMMPQTPQVNVMPTPMPNVMPQPQVQPMPNMVPQQPMPQVEPTSMMENRATDVIMPSVNFDYMDAIQSVHDLKDSLENRGYSVTLNESNLGGSYSFTISVRR